MDDKYQKFMKFEAQIVARYFVIRKLNRWGWLYRLINPVKYYAFRQCATQQEIDLMNEYYANKS